MYGDNMYFLYSMILSSNNETIKDIFYTVASVLTDDSIESIKIDYKLSDSDINNDFKDRLVNTIIDMDNNTYHKVLKRLNDNNII